MQPNVDSQLVAGFNWDRHRAADERCPWVNESENEGIFDDFIGSPKGFGMMRARVIAARSA